MSLVSDQKEDFYNFIGCSVLASNLKPDCLKIFMNAAASGKQLNEKDLGELIIYLQDEYVEELMVKNTHVLTSKPIREWLNILKEIEN